MDIIDEEIYDIDDFLNDTDKETEELNLSFRDLNTLPNLSRFTNLKTLILDANNLTSIPSLPSTLIKLSCNFNQIQSIPNLQYSTPNLMYLDCADNRLSELPPLPLTIKTVNCEYNHLKKICFIPESICKLDCANNNDLSFYDIKSFRTIQRFRSLYYRNKFGWKVEKLYIKNIRNKNINIDYLHTLYSPDFGFYKRFIRPSTLQYFSSK